MVSAVLALCAQSTLTMAAGTYTPAQLAALLSAQGLPTRVGPGLSDRVYALRWTKRPVSELAPALKNSVGVLLSREADGSYILQTDPTRDNEDEAIYGSYTAAFDKRFQDAMRQANAWGVFNPDRRGWERAARALNIPIVRDDQNRAQLDVLAMQKVLESEKTPQATKDTFQLMGHLDKWLNNSSNPGVSLLQLQKGVRSMVPNDQWVTGDVNQWLRSGYPSWMTSGVEEIIRNEMINRQAGGGRPSREQIQESQQRIAAYWVVQRTSFDLRTGTVEYERSAFNPDLEGQSANRLVQGAAAELAGFREELLADAQGDKVQLRLSRINREGYVADTVPIFRDEPNPKRLAEVLPPERKAQADAILARVAGTAAAVEKFQGEWKVRPGDATLTSPMLDWSTRSDKDFVMEISALGDHNRASNSRSIPPQGTLKALNVWAAENPSEFAPKGRLEILSSVSSTLFVSGRSSGLPTIPIFSATDQNGVLLVRNEASAFDRKVPGGMAELVRYRALCNGSFSNLLANAPSVPGAESLWWVQNEAVALDDMVALLPVFQYLSAVSPTTLAKLQSELKEGREFEIPLKTAPSGALADRLMKFVRASQYTGAGSVGKQLYPLHPRFPALLKEGKIVFRPEAGKCAVAIWLGSPGGTNMHSPVYAGEFTLTL
jgi:hypothetical protein